MLTGKLPLQHFRGNKWCYLGRHLREKVFYGAIKRPAGLLIYTQPYSPMDISYAGGKEFTLVQHWSTYAANFAMLSNHSANYLAHEVAKLMTLPLGYHLNWSWDCNKMQINITMWECKLERGEFLNWLVGKHDFLVSMSEKYTEPF